MKLTLEMQMDNSAFSDDWTAEAVWCLKEIIKGIENGRDWGGILDTNGNKIGSWLVEGE